MTDSPDTLSAPSHAGAPDAGAPDAAARFAAFRAAHPATRIRTAAQELGLSEAALVETGVDGPAVRLRADFEALLHALPGLGTVMALTRNDACVHEKVGPYAHVTTGLPHRIAQVLGDPIDLRLFLARWASAFAVEAAGRASLQVFDAHGQAVHKVFRRDETDGAAWDALVAAFRDDAAPPLAVAPRAAAAPDRPDADVDAAALLDGWAALQDTHDFYPLLRTHAVGRVQALRLAEGRFTERLASGVGARVLHAAAEAGTPVMVFAGNPGAIQIHTGPVQRVERRGPWINVLDAGFNLHLDETRVAEAWRVVKPTADGDVTAVELYDAAGAQIVQFFGERKPGRPELEAWRALVAGLPRA